MHRFRRQLGVDGRINCGDSVILTFRQIRKLLGVTKRVCLTGSGGLALAVNSALQENEL